MVTRFILLMPWGRVGSNLLLSILQKSAPMKVNNEGLNRLRTAADQESWFRAFYETGKEPASHQHIGSKQNLLAIRDLAGFSQLLLENQVRIVRLRRDNLVKAAVSQMRAEQYAEHTAEQTGVSRWAVMRAHEPLGPTRVDPEVLVQRISLMESLQGRLMAAFAAETVLDLEYEEINGALEQAVACTRRYLDLPHAPFRVPFKKATPDNLSVALINFDEIGKRLSATPWADQLHA